MLLKRIFTVATIITAASSCVISVSFANGDSNKVPANPSTHLTTTNTETNITHSIQIPPSVALRSSKNQPKQVLHTFNLSNANINSVTEEVAKITGKNFLVSPDLKNEQKTITIYGQGKMTTPEIYQVFLTALQVLGYGAVPAGNVIKIVKSQDAFESAPPIANRHYPGVGDEIVIRVVPVDNMTVTELQAALKPLAPQDMIIQPYMSANSVILAGYARNVKRLTEIIHDLDDQAAHQIDIVPLFNASADKIVTTLSSLTGNTGGFNNQSQVKFAADAQNNNVLIMGNAKARKRYKNLVQRLDTARNTGAGGTQVIHLNYLPAEKVAPVLAKIAEGSMQQLDTSGSSSARSIGGAAPINVSSSSTNGASSNSGKGDDAEVSNDSTMVQAIKDSNALILNAPASIMTSLDKVIKELDVPPRQVLIEAVIARVDQNLINDLGIVWGTSNAETQTTDSSGNVVTNSGFKEGIGYIPRGNIRAVVHALKQDISTDILATPTVVVLDNNKAMISDGKNIGIQNQQYAATNPAGADAGTSTDTSTQTGSNIPFTTYERKDVTLSLQVIPQISPNNKIRLKIAEQDDTLADPNSTSTNPELNTSKITTSVLASNSSILVLGGLVSHDQQEQVNRIPILSDFPVLGQLFKHRTKSAEKKDLMVFLRPVILKDSGDRTEVTKRRYDYMRNAELNKNAGLDTLTYAPGPVLPNIYHERPPFIPQPFTKEQIIVAKKEDFIIQEPFEK